MASLYEAGHCSCVSLKLIKADLRLYRTLNRFRTYVKLFLRFAAADKGGNKRIF